MMNNCKKFLAALALVSAVVSSSACVYTPENGDWISPATPISFKGYAQHGGKTIHIEAKNRQTGGWDEIGLAISSTAGTTWYGDTLYYWSTNIQLNTRPNWTCYFGIPGSCSIPSGSATIDLRFREEDSDLSALYTFDQGGLACVQAEAPNTGSWISAGAACASDNSPILTLNWLT